MKVEIWSDVMCPFCYIGKRRLEEALGQFNNAEAVQVEWRSFLLDADLKTDGQTNSHQYLAERKGISLEQSKKMHQNVVDLAKEVGLTYNFDKAVVANSFDARRLSQLAKQHGLDDAAEEALFKAYFTEGKDIADLEVLTEIGKQIGLDAAKVTEVLATDAYTQEVLADIDQAQTIGVRGVPFFVFNRKYAVSGAQPAEQFLQVLSTAYEEWKLEKK